ncbi:hypothetical protein QJS83_04395 [Bdellovibrio sp. 22V]|uniref:hypothetical protein n=1 Tax=Bdellovibrio TaxID=958 RepID=UPI00254368F3|nr:hypothetical protein [Bdellovibrio sp. 22V]WII73111.1 hypothetical protein QJS83_04395 [Bdellovibrio sp. 22V]
MRISILIFSFLLSWSAQAQVSRLKVQPPPPFSAVNLYLLNPELRYERDSSQELVNRRPLNFAFSFEYAKLNFMAEYARFTEETGNATSSIDRTHQDLVLWLRYSFMQRKLPEFSWKLFTGAGAGGYQEEVKTTLMGDSRTDKSDLKFMSGLVLGGEVAYSVNPRFGLLAGVEGRALLASDFDPNPIWSAVLRLGLQFPL